MSDKTVINVLGVLCLAASAVGIIGILVVAKAAKVQGCKDTMHLLYKDLGVNQVDEPSLQQFCTDLAKHDGRI